MTDKKITFLLGAGFSQPLGLSKTCEITEQVLSGKSVYYLLNGTFGLGEQFYREFDFHSDIVEACRKCSHTVLDRLKKFHSSDNSRVVSYEDISDYILQLHNCHTGERDNAAVGLALNDLDQSTKEIQSSTRSTVGGIDVGDVLSYAHNYISDIVCQMLRRSVVTFDPVKSFADVAQSKRGSVLAIATLNHDLIVDDLLNQLRIPATDGFGKKTNHIAYWDRRLLGRSPHIKLLKLHGSIDWYSWRSEVIQDDPDVRIGKTREYDIYHTVGPDEDSQWPSNQGRPITVIGTFGKEFAYSQDLFFDLHWWFRDSLHRSALLIVIGYGFRDKGINSRLVNALIANGHLRLLIIHPDRTSLAQMARPLWRRILGGEDTHLSGRVSFIDKSIEDVNCSTIIEAIEKVL